MRLWPSIVTICTWALGLTLAICQHGKKKEGTHDARYVPFAYALSAWVLYMGGYFDELLRRLLG